MNCTVVNKIREHLYNKPLPSLTPSYPHLFIGNFRAWLSQYQRGSVSPYFCTFDCFPFQVKVGHQQSQLAYNCDICQLGFKRRGMLVNHLAKRQETELAAGSQQLPAWLQVAWHMLANHPARGRRLTVDSLQLSSTMWCMLVILLAKRQETELTAGSWHLPAWP